MSATRRDLLKLTSAGLGSLAAIGFGTESAKACWGRRPQPVFFEVGAPGQKLPLKSGYGSPTIAITSLYSGATVGRMFTVYGEYGSEQPIAQGTMPAPFTFSLLDQGDSPVAGISITPSYSTDPKSWVANVSIPDYVVPDGGTGLKFRADLYAGGMSALPAIVTDLTLLPSSSATTPPGPPPITIVMPKFGDERAPKAAAILNPHGEVYERVINVVFVCYALNGGILNPQNDRVLPAAAGNKRTWRTAHSVGHSGESAFLVVTGVGMNEQTGRIRMYTVSQPVTLP